MVVKNIEEKENFINKNKFDKNSQEYSKSKYKWDIVWSNVIVLGLLHLFALYGAYIRCTGTFSWSTSIFIKVFAIMTGIGVTGGAHRLWTHRSYTANAPLQILLAFMFTCTYQNSIYIWSRDHRLHHKFSETDADPHNANRGFFFSHCGWLMVKKHPEVIEKGKLIDMSDLAANKIVMFQHRYYFPLVMLCAVILPMLIVTQVFGDSLQVAFFVAVAYRYIVTVNAVWCINSAAHLFGLKPYNKNIGPAENIFMKIFGLGEGYHNYHHTFPYDYNTAETGRDFTNPTAAFIDAFASIGWVTNRKRAPIDQIDKIAIKTGDGTRGTSFSYFTNAALFFICWFMVY